MSSNPVDSNQPFTVELFETVLEPPGIVGNMPVFVLIYVVRAQFHSVCVKAWLGKQKADEKKSVDHSC